MTNPLIKDDGKSYAILTSLSLAFGFYTVVIQMLMRHAFPGAWFYARTLVSELGTMCLLAALIRIREGKAPIIATGAAGSLALLVALLELLVEITPVAQGNNDSGEIFWFLAIPIIVFFCQASIAYLRVMAKRSERLMQV